MEKTWTARQRIGKLLVAPFTRDLLIRRFNQINNTFCDRGNILISAEYDDQVFIYPAQAFAAPAVAEFEGKPFPIPQQYHELLTIMYGDYMAHPPISERHTHFARKE